MQNMEVTGEEGSEKEIIQHYITKPVKSDIEKAY